MNKILLVLIFNSLLWMSHAQTFSLQVNNGYGSGNYHAGDTIHIWSKEWQANQYFKNWSGDVSYLESELEWHTRVLMPAKNVTINAEIGSLPANADFKSVLIRGADTLKRVHYYFPNSTTAKAVVWLFHGTNGFGSGWVFNLEMRHFANQFMAAGYAVVAMDCEEQTLDTDLNGDGVYRWTYGSDTINLADLANIRALKDTFINRGIIDINTPHVAAGFSAGGAFAENVSFVFQWRAGINHNTAGSPALSTLNSIPYFHVISVNDNHPDVGMAGNEEARQHAQAYLTRGVCMQFHEFYPQPVYPERFMRIENIDYNTSVSIYNDLKTNGILDNENYMRISGNQLAALVVMNPAKFPSLLTIFSNQREEVLNQLEVSNAEHNFKSDFNGRSIKFVNELCTTTGVENELASSITIYPNPANQIINLDKEIGDYKIIDLHGSVVYKGSENEINVINWKNGVYFIVSDTIRAYFLKI